MFFKSPNQPNRKQSRDNSWLVVPDSKETGLLLHKTLFERGFVAAAPTIQRNAIFRQKINNDSIQILKQQFDFVDFRKPDVRQDKKNEAKNVSNLLSVFTRYANALDNTPYLFEVNQNISLNNPKRRTEVYVPLLFSPRAPADNNTLIDSKGIYLYAWLDSNKNFNDPKQGKGWGEFEGFQQYVTAGCLFGSCLVGYDERGLAHKLIKHNIDLEGHTIQNVGIEFKELHPYEAMLFYELDNWMSLLNSFADQDTPKKLLYHLPCYDYILFGISLYLKKDMTEDALSQFVLLVLERAKLHREKITEICKLHGIEVSIHSPFEALFENGSYAYDIGSDLNVFSASPRECSVAMQEEIVEPLELFPGNNDNIVSENESSSEEVNLDTWGLDILEKLGWDINALKKISEEELVKIYLNKICSSNSELGAVWTEYFDANPTAFEQCKTVEDLFKIGNILMVALAARGKGLYRTCSFLPLSEKQIQLGYEKYSKNGAVPRAVNFTFQEAVVSHSCYVDKTIFQYTPGEEGLTKAIEKEHYSLLQAVSKNISFFAQGQSPILLTDIFTDIAQVSKKNDFNLNPGCSTSY
ncbi:MAG: hypothetical protein K2Q14_01765 [Gammaproteobacteria bacterium]|nr:hypothetical protein [Gammaproteobacteria bacterium]